MIELANPRLSAWESFYLIVGPSGAVLVGLQFVVITLITDTRRRTSMASIRAFGTPNVVQFAGALIISAVMTAPWHTLLSASIALVVCAFPGLAYALFVTQHARRQREYTPEREDWVWYIVVPCGLYAALAVGALILPGRPEAGLFIIAATALGFLMLGIRNAWDTVTYLVISHRNTTTD